MGQLGGGVRFDHLAEPVIERAAGVRVGQSDSPAQHRTGGTNGISGRDHIVHEVQWKDTHRPSATHKLVFVRFQAELSLATAHSRGLDWLGAGNGKFHAGTGDERRNGSSQGEIGTHGAIAGGNGHQPAWTVNEGGH